jgi:hypothetical protein
VRKYLLPIAVLALAGIPAAGAAPPAKTSTIAVRPSTVVFGHGVALSGRVTGKGSAGKAVQVEADAYPFEGNFAKVATPTANAAGNWTATDKPAMNTRYRARQGSTTSGLVTEHVRIAVGLSLSDSTPSAGARVRFSGQACPQHDGALVRIQRRTGSGSWHAVASTRLKDIPGSTCSSYSVRHRVSQDGTYRTLVVSGDPAFANGISARRGINVH